MLLAQIWIQRKQLSEFPLRETGGHILARLKLAYVARLEGGCGTARRARGGPVYRSQA